MGVDENMRVVNRKENYIIDDILKGELVETSTKYYAEAKEFYMNEDKSLKDDTKMYDVYHYTLEDGNEVGHLCWGLTVMYPVLINGECNMTRGHFHLNETCGEFYYGAQGNGLLMLMDAHGKTWAEEVFPGSVHYIKGSLAHRLINTGDEIFKVVACWPIAAGHDYERVEKQPFGYRVFKYNNKLKHKEIRR